MIKNLSSSTPTDAETNLTPDNNYEMKIIFAGDSIIRIISEVIEVTLDDQGDAWDTKNKPKHKTL